MENHYFEKEVEQRSVRDKEGRDRLLKTLQKCGGEAIEIFEPEEKNEALGIIESESDEPVMIEEIDLDVDEKVVEISKPSLNKNNSAKVFCQSCEMIFSPSERLTVKKILGVEFATFDDKPEPHKMLTTISERIDTLMNSKKLSRKIKRKVKKLNIFVSQILFRLKSNEKDQKQDDSPNNQSHMTIFINELRTALKYAVGDEKFISAHMNEVLSVLRNEDWSEWEKYQKICNIADCYSAVHTAQRNIQSVFSSKYKDEKKKVAGFFRLVRQASQSLSASNNISENKKRQNNILRYCENNFSKVLQVEEVIVRLTNSNNSNDDPQRTTKRLLGNKMLSELLCDQNFIVQKKDNPWFMFLDKVAGRYLEYGKWQTGRSNTWEAALADDRSKRLKKRKNRKVP